MLFELYKRPNFITFGASGSGRSLVNSVNEKTGDVVLDAADIAPVTDRNFVTDAELAAIGTGGGADNPFDAFSDGINSAVAALLAADAAGERIVLEQGTYLVDQSLALTRAITFAGGQLKIADGVVMTMPNPKAGLVQLFDLTGTGSVMLSNGSRVHPEWWGETADAVQQALDQSATGASVILQGREYVSNGIVFVGDTNSAGGRHCGKQISGQIPSQRVDDGAGFFGSRIKLTPGANIPLLDVSVATGTVLNGRIRNVTLDANKTQQTFSDVDGVVVTDVSGFEIGTVQVLDAAQDGIALLGTDNDIVLTGQIEISGAGRDGINASVVGSSQFNGTIKTHANGRHGLNMGANGQLNAQFIHSYANLGEGVRWACSNPSYIHLLRCEDNGLTGLFYTGDALVIGTAVLPDNGLTATTTTTQCGVSDQGLHLRIRTLSNPVRNGTGIVHNQKTLYFGNSTGAVVQTVFDTATEANLVTAGQTLNIFNSKRNLLGPKIIERRSYSGTLSAHNSATYGFRPIQCPDIYGAVHISDIANNYFVANTNFSRSAHGTQLELRFSAAASGNLNWDSSYLDGSGNPMSSTAMTAGNDYDFAFIRRAAFWFLIP